MSEAAGQVILDIISQVAEFEECDPTNIEPPLASYINTDALVNLVEENGSRLRITFEYIDYEVTVFNNGDGPTVFVRPQ